MAKSDRKHSDKLKDAVKKQMQEAAQKLAENLENIKARQKQVA